jgi:hypothetical protein
VSEGQENKAGIRTPDRRLRVFVSSALGELADERHAVARAISALRLTPVMFEQGARPHPPRDMYRACLARSGVFIGLYWQRYGQAPPRRGYLGPGREVRPVGEAAEAAVCQGAGPRPRPAAGQATGPDPAGGGGLLPHLQWVR